MYNVISYIYHILIHFKPQYIDHPPLEHPISLSDFVLVAMCVASCLHHNIPFEDKQRLMSQPHLWVISFLDMFLHVEYRLRQ